jgi:hypothetical protein
MLSPDIENSDIFRDVLGALYDKDELYESGEPIGARVMLDCARARAVSALGSVEEADKLFDMARREYRYTKSEMENLG